MDLTLEEERYEIQATFSLQILTLGLNRRKERSA
jgi:hypothetical protein